ncbi:Aspartyl/glutamyl-tRNA(Asn/Gln) amidotransferase subunit C [Candidatus Saccharibacteria bacterium RAAC3_TM7_1]|nr:Aspartyl/glutamyl-tRNA(Asn/Gln) amidotransferase subunit C [Candidatus Saccharibacteria bacterium RAAC3_TM7_1]HCZ28890.1 Asp-tRNA(Asn)/Glu-tRNA(Gln) amidotransferase subunit GatC [Candidatus Saccharibacteria bacterium]
MTQISRATVVQLATLSSLQLADDEIDGLVTDLGNIIKYVEQLDELDTEGVEPTYQVTNLENVSREDAVQQSEVSRQTLLALAPEQTNRQIKVPKVL